VAPAALMAEAIRFAMDVVSDLFIDTDNVGCCLSFGHCDELSANTGCDTASASTDTAATLRENRIFTP
jgi:hypothetical protein